MLDAVAKYVGAKVVAALCFVGSAAAVIWFWRHPESLAALWAIIKYSLAWLGFATALPWATYPVLPAVLRRESNGLSAAFLLGLCALDVVVALWLCGWTASGALTWTVLLLGFIAAGAYNFVVCESLARHLEAS